MTPVALQKPNGTTGAIPWRLVNGGFLGLNHLEDATGAFDHDVPIDNSGKMPG